MPNVIIAAPSALALTMYPVAGSLPAFFVHISAHPLPEPEKEYRQKAPRCANDPYVPYVARK